MLEELKRQGIKCKCIRCREIGLYEKKIEFSKDDVLLFRIEYNASRGKEIFLSLELKDRMFLLGFLRLRIMSDPLRKELQAESDFISRSSNKGISDSIVESFTSAIVRELHVYGSVVKVGEQVKKKKESPTNWTKSDMIVGDGDNNNGSIQSMLNPAANDGGLVPNNQVEYQHRGLGRRLLTEAERICREEYGLKKISVISAVGTRDYYRKFGYTNNGPYVTKLL